MKRTVVIAAAGSGRRLAADLPKCMIKINNHYIFEYLLKAFEQYDEIRMVVGYKAEMVAEAVSAVSKDVVLITNKDYDKSSGPLQSLFLGSAGLTGKVLYSVGDVIYSRSSAAALYMESAGEDEFVTITGNISENPIFADVQSGCRLVQLDRRIVSEFEFAGSAFIDSSKIENKDSFFFEQLNHYMPLKTITIERLEVDTKADFSFAEKAVSENPDQYDFWK
jgi:NDP-sugar pyrophosphorylase family protein